jgi:hypothetical protein
MPLAMLLTVIGIGLSGLLAASLNAQVQAGRTTAQRAEAADAAQSGIEVALGQIRAARNADGTGDYAKLPCGPFSGAVNTGTKQTYTVHIHYLTAQPPAGDLAWAQANRLPCTGAVLTAGKPLFVLLSATGKATPAQRGRVVNATYTLHTKSRENVAGGLVRLYGSTPQLCMAAPADTPADGDPLTMRLCDADSGTQRFAYDSDLNLVLVASRANGSAGMCLDAAGHLDPVVFRPCAAVTDVRQQWSLNDRGSFEGTTDGVTLNGTCFHLTSPGTAGSAVVLHAAADDAADVAELDRACRTEYSSARTFTPDPDVGTGGAGTPIATSAGQTTTQLVNFDQFGRCLDVTADDVTAGHLVIWPCKQSPNGQVQWNQVWTLPTPTGTDTSATGTIRTTWNGQDHCLLSPGSTTGYVRVQPCAEAVPAAIEWTRRYGTGVFANAYRIESTYGAPAGTTYCLAPTDPSAVAPDLWQQGASKSVLRECDDSAALKWNASPTILTSSLTDLSED